MRIQPAAPGLSFVPDDVLTVMKKIHEAGFGVWIVGGALRDYYLGSAPKDWDLATDACPGSILSIFPRVIPVGIRHGTVQVHTRTRDIEVTSCDIPGKAGILKDLSRRDFTINSLAVSYPGGVLIDPNHGLADLDAGLLRAVGNPSDRFSEDPLRIIRAARLRGVYGFDTDAATFEAMRRLARAVEIVSGERVRDEMLKILLAENVRAGFNLLRDCGALDIVLPRLMACDGVYDRTISRIVCCPENSRVRLAALFHDIAGLKGEPGPSGTNGNLMRESARIAAGTMKNWNMSNRCIEEVSSLVANRLPPDAYSWSDVRIRQFLAGVDRELIDDFFSLAEAGFLSGAEPGGGDEAGRRIERTRVLRERMRAQIERAPALNVRELAIDGGDVMRVLGVGPGPRVGVVLKRLLDMVLEDPGLNTRDRLAELAVKFKETTLP